MTSGAGRLARRAVLGSVGRVSAGVAVAALLGAGAVAPARARAASAATVLITSFGYTCEAPVFVAQAQGYFRDEGLDVTLTSVATPAKAVTRLAQGRADAAPHPAFALAAQWLPPGVQPGDVVATAGPERGCNSLLVAADSPYRRLADLKGQKVAAGAPWHFIYGEPMAAVGIDPQKDIDWQPQLAMPAIGAALASKSVAAALALEPLSATLEAAGAVRGLVVQDMPPLMMDYCCNVIVPSASLRADRSKGAALTRALMRGSAWTAAHPDETAQFEVAGKYVAATPAVNQRAIATIAFVPAVLAARANTLDLFGRMVRLGFLASSTDLEALTNQVFVPVTEDLPVPAQVPMGGQGVAEGADPRSHATDSAGQALWASQHDGDPSGYARASRADQITWNAVAIHGS